MEWFTSSTGAIELQMTIEQAQSVTHPGDCEADVRVLSNMPTIKAQTDKIAPETLVKVLDDYGTWNEEQLKDHDQNIQRLLWLAGGDIADRYEEPE